MGIDLNKLVRFVGREGPAMNRLREAVEWVAGTPEGAQMLKDAEELHGKPLMVSNDFRRYGQEVSGIPVDMGSHYIAMDANGKHVHAMYIDPLQMDKPLLSDEHGKSLILSYERAVAHELKHAGQNGIIKAHMEKVDAESSLLRRVSEKVIEKVRIVLPRLKLALKERDIESGVAVLEGDRESLEKIVSATYDTHMNPHVMPLIKEVFGMESADARVQEFHVKMEKPAIEAENAVMRHHPENTQNRKLDYTQSMNAEHFASTARSGDIEAIVEDAVATHNDRFGIARREPEQLGAELQEAIAARRNGDKTWIAKLRDKCLPQDFMMSPGKHESIMEPARFSLKGPRKLLTERAGEPPRGR